MGTNAIRTLLGDGEATDKLEGLGIKEVSASEAAVIQGLKTGRDISIVGEGLDSNVTGLIAYCGWEIFSTRSKGATVVCLKKTLGTALQKEAKKLGLLAASVGSAEESHQILYGEPSDVLEFFQGEVARALDIGRLIIVGTASDQETIKQLAQSASKRGSRPQINYVGDSFEGECADALQGIVHCAGREVQHLFLDVAGELLSKPSALGDIIESEARPRTIVFCNQPSDTDLLEVILRKRGIPTRKMIGNVPPGKVTEAMADIKSGALIALVVTDIALQNMHVDDFQLAINYSIHSDPEVYVHRTEKTKTESLLEKVISLVGPLDKANFHYLRKIVEASFNEFQPPSPEKLLDAKVATIRTQALAFNAEELTKSSDLYTRLSKESDKDKIFLYLLHAALNQQPARAAAQSSSNDDFEYDDQRGGGRGRDRGGDRDNRRGGGGRINNNRRGGGDRYFDGGDDGPPNRSTPHPRRNPPMETEKIARVYVGAGTKEGMSEERLRELLSEDPEGPIKEVRRISVRAHYTFVDLPETSTDDFINSLNETGKAPSVVKKAVTLAIPKPGAASPEGGEENFAGEGESSEESEGEVANAEA